MAHFIAACGTALCRMSKGLRCPVKIRGQRPKCSISMVSGSNQTGRGETRHVLTSPPRSAPLLNIPSPNTPRVAGRRLGGGVLSHQCASTSDTHNLCLFFGLFFRVCSHTMISICKLSCINCNNCFYGGVVLNGIFLFALISSLIQGMYKICFQKAGVVRPLRPPLPTPLHSPPYLAIGIGVAPCCSI